MIDAIQETDRALAQAALIKRQQNQTPSRAEAAALDRVQQAQLAESLKAIKPKMFRALCDGMQHKQMHDWENKYGIPCGKGRPKINLFDVFTQIRKLIADNATALSGGGGSSVSEKKKEKLEKEIERLSQQIRKIENENKEIERSLIPKSALVERHERMATIIRNLGDRLARKKTIRGPDAQQMINDALLSYENELKGVDKT